jgi:hypothetical protein
MYKKKSKKEKVSLLGTENLRKKQRRTYGTEAFQPTHLFEDSSSKKEDDGSQSEMEMVDEPDRQTGDPKPKNKIKSTQNKSSTGE